MGRRGWRPPLENHRGYQALAVNQDSLGIQGKRIFKQGLKEVWSRPLEDVSWAVILFNRSLASRLIEVEWSALKPGWEEARVRDLWARENLGMYTKKFGDLIKGRSAMMVRVWGR